MSFFNYFDFSLVCLAALVVSILLNKKLNSHVVTSALSAIYFFISNATIDFVMSLAVSSGVSLGRLLWYGGYSFFSFIFLYGVFITHRFLNLNLGATYRSICVLFIFTNSLQLVGYLDAEYFSLSILDFVYRKGIELSNLAFCFVIAFGVGEYRYYNTDNYYHFNR
jgi:hypothetical protein